MSHQLTNKKKMGLKNNWITEQIGVTYLNKVFPNNVVIIILSLHFTLKTFFFFEKSSSLIKSYYKTRSFWI